MKIKKPFLFAVAGYFLVFVLNSLFFHGENNVGQVLTAVDYILLFGSSVLTLIFIYKKLNASKVLKKASENDQAWNENKLKIIARDVFYKLQSSWENGDTTPLVEIATSRFLEFFKEKRSANPTAEKQVIGLMDITLTDIVACSDYIHNDKDCFTAHLSGSLTIYEKAQKGECYVQEFSEMYHFVRSGNSWLLDEVTGQHQLLHFLLMRSILEKTIN